MLVLGAVKMVRRITTISHCLIESTWALIISSRIARLRLRARELRLLLIAAAIQKWVRIFIVIE